MPDRQCSKNVTYNREKLRKTITKFDFKEARRVRGPIYDALISELYEVGCRRAAKCFKTLVDKENDLYAKRFIRECVHSRRDLLLMLFENAKNAEQSARLGHCGGNVICMQLLYQCLLLVEQQGKEFDWLLSNMYDMVAEKMFKMDPNEIMLNEIKVKIFYKYGTYLWKKGSQVELTEELLNIALQLSKGQSWEPDTSLAENNKYKTMHEIVARRLGKVYLSHAKEFLNKNPEYAMKLTNKAILTLAEVGLKNNILLLCEAYISKIKFMFDCGKFESALKGIYKVENELVNAHTFEFTKLRCDNYIQKGICYYNLNEYKKAKTALRQAFILCHKHDIKSLEAEICLQMGKVYAKIDPLKARDAFQAAQCIAIEQKNITVKKTADYMLAKLKADQIFPAFMHMVKSKDYCAFFQLRQWKNQVKPFWQETKEQSSSVISLSEQHSQKTCSSTIYKYIQNDVDGDGDEIAVEMIEENTFTDEQSSKGIEKSSSHMEAYGSVNEETDQPMSRSALAQDYVRRNVLCLIEEFPNEAQTERTSANLMM